MDVDHGELMRLLQEDLGHAEIDVQVAAAKRLAKLAKVMGPEGTQNSILPHLLDFTAVENPEDKAADEVLYNLGTQLGNFLPLVEGVAQAEGILGPLAEIATTEETLVRDAAVTAMKKVLKELPSDGSLSSIASKPLRRLSGDGDEPIWFTAKVSACGILAAAYEKMTDADKEVAMTLLKKHCQDELPMVRRAAAGALAELGQVVEKAGSETGDLYELWVKLCGDVYDNVRLLGALAIGDLIGKLPPATLEDATAQFLRLGEDKSWRVRLSGAKVFGSVAKGVGPDLMKDSLVNVFVQLLQDHEAEVRAAACKSVNAVCSVVGAEVFSKTISPILNELSQDAKHDPDLKVRMRLVRELTRMPSMMSTDDATACVLPVLSTCLSGAKGPQASQDVAAAGVNLDLQLMVLRELSTGDEGDALNTSNAPSGVQRPWMKDRGTAEEREALLKVLVQSLEPSFLEGLLHDPNWRVREAAVLCIPRVVSIRGPEYFESFSESFYGTSDDKVAAVRRAAGQCLGDLSKQLGADHTLSKILPRLRVAAQGPSYCLRISAVEALGWLCIEGAGAEVLEEIATALTQACSDSVANVRFAAVCSLARLVKVVNEDVLQSTIVPQITELLQDDEEDVKTIAASIMELASE
mmetsp:Transcript_10997/g.41051  ORF Transcript_10997/g.41051 Transcript_10997/m.41051 type:complete len:638 (+) Transcript_10997:213-2126(+)